LKRGNVFEGFHDVDFRICKFVCQSAEQSLPVFNVLYVPLSTHYFANSSNMTDRLASLLAHFSISAKTFHAGALCGINSLTGSDGLGQLHLIRQGEVKVMHGTELVAHINEPSLLLYAQPLARRFLTDKAKGQSSSVPDLSFEGGKANPVRAALPAFVCLPLSGLRDSKPVLDLLFAEAAGTNCGRQKMLDSLFEVLLIQILRELMEHHLVQSGMLAGMGHPRLRRAWSLCMTSQNATGLCLI
jgi:hypothetical protein